jgi:hypothetical protein
VTPFECCIIFVLYWYQLIVGKDRKGIEVSEDIGDDVLKTLCAFVNGIDLIFFCSRAANPYIAV